MDKHSPRSPWPDQQAMWDEFDGRARRAARGPSLLRRLFGSAGYMTEDERKAVETEREACAALADAKARGAESTHNTIAAQTARSIAADIRARR